MRATTPNEVIMMTLGASLCILAQQLGIAPWFFVIVTVLYVRAVLKERQS